VREPGNERNELPDIMRRWFGADAGMSGTSFQVIFRESETGWTLEPRRIKDGDPAKLRERGS
jgi:hypothetical protein